MTRVTRIAMLLLLRADDFLAKCINRLAIEYDGGVHVKHRLMRYHDFFVERISSGERVLDIGCGYGAVAYSVASRTNAMVVGIDLRAENIAKARQLFQHSNLVFRQGDVLQSLPEESFDVIMLSNILEHIEHRVEFLSTLHERLSPHRYLIRVPMFDREWTVPLRKELGMPYFSDRTHFTEYTQESFEKEIRAAGLMLTHVQINWGEIWAEASPVRA